MYTDNDEGAYCEGRVKRSTALAGAATDGCARIAHTAMADLYERRRVGLMRSGATSPAALVAVSPTRVRT